jgi:hydrogenase maturation protease
MKIGIIGIGQTMRGDDGVGPAVVDHWRVSFPELSLSPEIGIFIEEIPGLNILSMLEGMQAAIIVDAIMSSDEPGTIRFYNLDEILSFGTGTGSAHGFGLAEALRLMYEIDPASLPARIILMCLEIEQVEIGHSLSQSVKNALPRAVDLLNTEVKRLLDNP